MSKVYGYGGDSRKLTMPIIGRCAWFYIDNNGGEVECRELRLPGWGYCEKHHAQDMRDKT